MQRQTLAHLVPGVSAAVRRLLPSVLALVCACSSGQVPPRPTPTPIRDGELLARAYHDRLNAEDVSGILALLVTEPTLVEPFSDPPQATVHRGYANVARFFTDTFRLRDDRVVVEHVQLDGSRITVLWSMHGTDGVGMSGQTRFSMRGGRLEEIEIQRRD